MTRLREALRNYLQLRRNLGFKLHDHEVGLSDFVSFYERERARHVTVAIGLRWATQHAHHQPAEWARRLRFVRGFARYLKAVDPFTEVPPPDLLPYRPARARPYLYSTAEILRLLKAARKLPSRKGLRPLTYHCLFGLLTVTGMRISEILCLERPDVDFISGVLTIRKTKFGKSRLVPLHPSTLQMLVEYARRRDSMFPASNTACFLVSDYGRRLEGSAVRRIFYRLSRQIGLRGPSASHGPRLHDFRHRFAVETLLAWYHSGEDVERRLPILSAYLGHAHVTDTYWYLSTCPELMNLATLRLEKQWEGWS
jgi:integrase/recombinase XerD